jgi:hypothetical protein
MGSEMYIEKILAVKGDVKNDSLKYLIQWVGLDKSHNSWLSAKYIEQTAIQAFQALQSRLIARPSVAIVNKKKNADKKAVAFKRKLIVENTIPKNNEVLINAPKSEKLIKKKKFHDPKLGLKKREAQSNVNKFHKIYKPPATSRGDAARALQLNK